MAKKKSRRSARRRRAARSQTRPRSQATSPSRAPKPAAPRPTQEVDFREEYHYVIADLRRFGLTALAMFALLITLAVAL